MMDKNAVFYLWLSHTKTCTSKYDDDYPDLNSHHNERPARDRPDEQPEPQTNPAPAPEKEPARLTTYDPAGEIPFSNWDGEEGQPP